MLAGRGTEDADDEDEVAEAEEDGSAVVEVAANCGQSYQSYRGIRLVVHRPFVG